MNKEWFTAQELTEVEGMPSSPFSIRRKAQKESWTSRKRETGKGFEYHISSFEPLIQAQIRAKALKSESFSDDVTAKAHHLMQKEASITHQESNKKASSKLSNMTRFAALPENKQAKAHSKAVIVQAMDAFLAPFKGTGSLTEAERQFVQQYNQGILQFDASVYQQVKQISWPSLRRWKKALDEQGMLGLVGHVGKKSVPSKIEQQTGIQNFLIAVITKKPHFASKPNRLHDMLKSQASKFPEWDIPSPSSIGRWLKQWLNQNGAAFAYLTDPDGYNSKHRPLYARMYPWLTQPNDCWEFDSTPTDVQLRVNGKLTRYSVVAAIDVYTRRVKFILSPTSDSEAICLLLRKCLKEWGVLNENGVARTDNGSDYVSKRVTAIFNMLNIDAQRANAFSGWEKPYIERFFRTLSEGLFELLPGYIGHNVSDRQKIEAARAFAKRIGAGKKQAEKEAIELAFSPDELETIINDWIEHDYNHRSHSGEGMNGATPFEKFANSGYKPRLVNDDHAFDYLLNYAGMKTVVRGQVSNLGIKYSAPALMNPEWNGRKVRVFIDPTDVGRCTLYPETDWGQYVEAININLVGQEIDPAKFREARKQQTKTLSDFRRSARKLQEEFGIETMAAEQLAAKKAADNLQNLTLKTELTDNQALNALANAGRKNTEVSYTPEQLAELEQARLALETQQASLNERKGLLIRDEHEKATYLAEQSNTRELTEKETEFLENYMDSNPFSRQRVEEIMARRRQA